MNPAWKPGVQNHCTSVVTMEIVVELQLGHSCLAFILMIFKSKTIIRKPLMVGQRHSSFSSITAVNEETLQMCIHVLCRVSSTIEPWSRKALSIQCWAELFHGAWSRDRFNSGI